MTQKRSLPRLGLVLYALVLGGLAAQTAAAAPARSGDVILIINGDDVGITPVFTDSTLKALLEGTISSASICSGSHDADRAIALLKKHPELSIGVHLTLTGDWKPLTPRETAPSLYGKAGTFWNTEGEARKNVKPEHARIEWEAQIRKVKDAGIKISHLDSHMGCYFLSPELFQVAFDLSRQYKIPLMAAYYPNMPKAWKNHLPVSGYLGIYSIPGKSETLENRTEAYRNMLQSLQPGVYYFFTHQGILPAGGRPYGDLDLRVNEYKFWSGPEKAAMLKDLGITVKPFSTLKNVFNACYK